MKCRDTAFVLVAVLIVFGAGQAFALAENDAQEECPAGAGPAITSPAISDTLIQNAVAMRLAGSISSTCYPVWVYVNNGAVTLVGQVESAGMIDLATIFVSGIRGVVCIDNQLSVAPVVTKDMQLIGAVRAALAKQPFRTRQIGIRAADGIVELSGLVGSDWDREQAAQVAAGVPGVAAVHNNIGVSGPGSLNW